MSSEHRRELSRIYAKTFREKHAAAVKQNDSIRYKKNRSKKLDYFRNQYKENPVPKITHAKETNKRYRLAIIALLGGKCSRCGYDTDYRALQVDHVNGGGTKERAIFGTNSKLLFERISKSLLNKELKYQLLCANCNWIKRYDNGEFGRRGKSE